jgi:hypothetical protein
MRHAVNLHLGDLLMTETSSSDNPSNKSPAPPKLRVRSWFLAGFLLGFLGIALAVPALFYDGRSVRQTWLWHYYLLEIRQQLNSSGNLGPTSGNEGALLSTAAFHVLFAVIVGLVFAGIAWLVNRR